jgi:hypothetical protein
MSGDSAGMAPSLYGQTCLAVNIGISTETTLFCPQLQALQCKSKVESGGYELPGPFLGWRPAASED